MAVEDMAVGQVSVGALCERVCRAALVALPAAQQVSVTVVSDGVAGTAAFVGSGIAALDERQYAQSSGPCLDAARTGEVVHLVDTAHDETYPDFAALAQRWGITSVLALPLSVAGSTVGAVNLACTTGHALDEGQVRAARAFAHRGAGLLAGAVALESARSEVAHLRTAMDSRAVIEQAKGVLIARHGVDADTAFAALSERSQRENRKVREIAADLIAGLQREGAVLPG